MKRSPFSPIQYRSKMAFRSISVFPSCSVRAYVRSFILCFPGSTWFKKSIRRSLFGSEPNSFLKPKSVNGLIYLSWSAMKRSFDNKNTENSGASCAFSDIFQHFLFYLIFQTRFCKFHVSVRTWEPVAIFCKSNPVEQTPDPQHRFDGVVFTMYR